MLIDIFECCGVEKTVICGSKWDLYWKKRRGIQATEITTSRWVFIAMSAFIVISSDKTKPLSTSQRERFVCA